MPPLQVFHLGLDLCICRLDAGAAIPAWATRSRFYSVTGTADETSIVCETQLALPGVRCEPGWNALGLRGPIDFSAIGILATLVVPLAEAGISVFAISTWDTDYLLVRTGDVARAVVVLSEHGIQT